ncbi:MAG TPA: helix-turn-helix domain-containing protein [Terriglobales bacterium]|jgi:excisionase family DNA binding protein|nr:helix-turn-helix domain-containing protein [Terriglobales bacterium]
MENSTTVPNLGFRLTEDALLNAEEVAQILRVPKSWIYSHLHELPAIRLGRYVRFRRCEIEHFLEERSGACQ